MLATGFKKKNNLATPLHDPLKVSRDIQTAIVMGSTDSVSHFYCNEIQIVNASNWLGVTTT